jgi:hypothetical protein
LDAHTVTHVGFTGTRNLLTRVQDQRLSHLLFDMRQVGWDTFHHGDCLGADKRAFEIAKHHGFWTICHPPLVKTLRAFTKSHETREERPYIARNNDIVDETGFLIATPDGPERLRSGTWATIRYARQLRRRGRIIYPSGEVSPL